MSENNEESLYEQIRAFAQQFSCDLIEGVTLEINMFFCERLAEGIVKDFILFFDYDTNHYKLEVVLEELSIATVHRLFLSFFRFIVYSGSNLSIKKSLEQRVHYEFASFTEEGRGFYCEIDFLMEAREMTESQEPYSAFYLTDDALRSNSGQQPDIQWQCKIEAMSYLPPFGFQDMVFMLDMNQKLYAIDAENGTIRWQQETDNDFFFGNASLLRGDDDILCVVVRSRQYHTETISLSALDAQSGVLLKSFPIPPLQTLFGFNLFVIDNGVAYLSGIEGRISEASPDQQCTCLAIDLRTGNRIWTIDLGKYQGTTSPVVANMRVYLTTLGSRDKDDHFGCLHAFDARTGETLWKYTFARGRPEEVVVAGEDVIIVGCTLDMLDALSGTKRWSLPGQNMIWVGNPIVTEELIYTSYENISPATEESKKRKKSEILLAGGPTHSGGLIAVDRTSKKIRWITPLPNLKGGHFIDKTCLSDDVLYTTRQYIDRSGSWRHATLFAHNIHTGEEYWRFEADELSAPFVAHKKVFIQGRKGDDTYLYALTTADLGKVIFS